MRRYFAKIAAYTLTYAHFSFHTDSYWLSLALGLVAYIFVACVVPSPQTKKGEELCS